MPAGLLAAQTFHVGSEFLLRRIVDAGSFSEEELSWMPTPYVAVVKVQTYEELVEIHDNAIRQVGDQHVTKWVDDLVHPVTGSLLKTFVGISIGPCDSDKIRAVTGDLPRY
jgi:peptidyl-tRNA hydrolase